MFVFCHKTSVEFKLHQNNFLSFIMAVNYISFIILLGINIVVAQNYWNRYHRTEYPSYFENDEFYDVLNFNPSRLRSYGMVGIPSVRPPVRNYAINDSFEVGIPPIGPADIPTAQNRHISILDYLLHRQHVVSKNYK